MSVSRRCAISIDLDDLSCYYRIHGLGAPPAQVAAVIMERALPRAAEFFVRHGLVATWFVVGRDVDSAVATAGCQVGRAALQALYRDGHELGNHSYSHPYGLARMTEPDVTREIADCDRVLRELTGAPVLGFRAPGYDISAAAMFALAALRYRYDSSIFPAPVYYLAKMAVMGALALRRRPSGAVMTHPLTLLAPRRPYRPALAAPWRRGQAPLVELPIAVTPGLRAPVIGTSLLASPDRVRHWLLAAMADEPVFNLELHGMDFVDAEGDGIPGQLVARQPDLRIPVAIKLARLDTMVAVVKRRFAVVTLAEIAASAQRDY